MFLSMLVSSCLVLLVNSVQYAPVVNIEGGRIRGLLFNLTTGHVVRKYLGIPFAKADRFKAPTNDDSKWSDVKDMITFGNECPQLPSAFGGNSGIVSEDCLNLNVFVPHVSNSSSLPVMVWVHGGGYLFGSNRLYDGSYISSLGDVIVVAINYRITVFGFLATGENGDLKGNYGMLDQVQALKWVKQNIAGFGGGPNKVTIFGESAGGSSVSLLMLSPLTKGLFQNVVMQSGAASAKWAAVSYKQIEEVTRAFGKRIGCTNLEVMAECLKTKSTMQIVNSTLNKLSFAPVIDGDFLPETPSLLLQNGEFPKCNTMVGVTNDEGTVITNAVPGAGLPSGMDVTNGIHRDLFKEVVKVAIDQKPPLPSAMIYRYTDWTNVSDPYRNRRMFIDMMSDAMFIAPAIRAANAFVNNSLPIYFYQLQHRADNGMFGRVPSWVRAYHFSDIFYVFGFPLMSANASLLKTIEANFSRDIIRLWTNFAKTGNPNQPESITIPWPQYDLRSQKYIALKPTMALGAKLRAEYVAFWNDFIPDALRSLPKDEPCNVPSDGKKIIAELLVITFAFIASLLGVGY